MSRDRIAALLWPESGEERARHALAQLLYSLRRDLGEDVVVGGGTELRLNGAVLSSDVEELDAAHAAGDPARIVELYEGPFLDGFHLGGCAEFDRWLEQQRSRIALRAQSAIEALAERAAEAGDVTGAVAHWRRLAALVPYDSRVAVRLMRALADAGDRAGAIRHARIHGALLEDELGTQVDPFIASFAESLATMPEPMAPAAAAGPPVREPAQAPEAAHERSAAHSAPNAAARAAPPKPAHPGNARRARRLLIGAACLAGIGSAALAFQLNGRTGAGPRELVILAAVENRTGESVFDQAISVGLEAALRQSSRIRVMPPDRMRQAIARMREPGGVDRPSVVVARQIAQREGARVVIAPDLARLDSVYVLTLKFIDMENGAVFEAFEERTPQRDRVIDAIDRVARRARRAFGESSFAIATRTVPLPEVTTGSLDALQKYADGSRAFSLDQLDEARLLWEQAIQADSGFAAAYSALGALEAWLNRPAAAKRWFDLALAHLDRLPERDRVLIRAESHAWQGDREAATVLLRSYLLRNPEDGEFWKRLGYEYLRTDQDSLARDVFVRAVQFDSTDYSTLINLATVEKSLGHWSDAIASYKRAFALAPSLEATNNNLNLEFGGTYVLAGDLASAAAVFEKMLAGGPGLRARGLRSMAFLAMYRGDFAEAARHIAESVPLLRAVVAPVSELRNHMLLASTLDLLDRGGEAAEHRDSAFAISRRIETEATLVYWLGKALARAGDVQRATQLLEALEPRVREGATDRAAIEGLRGEVLVARGQPDQGVLHLERAYGADRRSIVLESLAWAVTNAGEVDRAAALYEDLARNRDFGWEGQLDARTALYHLGRVQEQRGDRAQAMLAYQRFLESWPATGVDILPVADARSRLAALRASERTPGG